MLPTQTRHVRPVQMVFPLGTDFKRKKERNKNRNMLTKWPWEAGRGPRRPPAGGAQTCCGRKTEGQANTISHHEPHGITGSPLKGHKVLPACAPRPWQRKKKAKVQDQRGWCGTLPEAESCPTQQALCHLPWMVAMERGQASSQKERLHGNTSRTSVGLEWADSEQAPARPV